VAALAATVMFLVTVTVTNWWFWEKQIDGMLTFNQLLATTVIT